MVAQKKFFFWWKIDIDMTYFKRMEELKISSGDENDNVNDDDDDDEEIEMVWERKKKLSILSDIKFYLIHENPFHVLRNMINFSSFPFIAVEMETFFSVVHSNDERCYLIASRLEKFLLPCTLNSIIRQK